MAATPLDRRALGLHLTRLANASVGEALALNDRADSSRTAYRLGLTGPPGAGKSSLAGRLAQLRSPGTRLGILAIDPTSPKSGGAILGDRIRMDDLTGIEDLYIRSFGSRSATDGLTDNLPELLATMDIYGFDEVIIETVGVGQAEFAIRPQVDTLVLVLLPDSGDAIQAMKAGIMEMADIFVVNKSDLPGARKMAADISRIISMRKKNATEWVPPVVLTSFDQQKTVAALSNEIDRHRSFIEYSADHSRLAQARASYRLTRLIERECARVIAGLNPCFFDAPLSEQYTSVLSLLKGSD